MALDLSKQVGPLPLGAWLAVVAGGLGIAWYTTRTAKPPAEPMENISGTPGVGTGAPADWTPINGTGGGQAQPPAITTNEQWGQRAISWLIGMGYPSVQSDSAVRKYLSATKMSVQETTLIGVVLVGIGPPPQQLPPAEEGDPDPPPVNPPPANPPAAEAPRYVSVPLGFNLYQMATELAAAYPGHGITFTRLFGYFPGDITALNPGHRAYMVWPEKVPMFRASGGVPPIRIRT